MSRRGSVRARWAMASESPAFDPRMVPEVAAGYFWHPSLDPALGASWKRVEGNGRTTFDLLSGTIAAQPSDLGENGQRQYRMRKVADAAPSIVGAAAAAAGWTGSTYIAGWFRLPDASGDITGSGNLIAHTGTAGPLFRITLTDLINVVDRQATVTSNNGTTTASNQWASLLAGGAWHWLSLAVIPGTSVELSSDLVQAAHLITAVPGTPLNDSVAPLAVGCRFAANLANVDTTDTATVVYANGIPDLLDQQRLMAWKAPIAVSFV